MSLFEDVSTLFAAAITDGQDNEAIVKAAYEDLLGYADADTMNNSAARIDYWVQKLSSGELTTDNFGGSFLEEANTNQGSLISSTTFENNQTVVAAHEDAYEANPDVTLEDLTAVAAENRVEDVAEEDEGVTGETFTLTTGVDQVADFTGGSGDDVFIADDSGNAVASVADTIDGGGGADTLEVYTAGGALPTMSNIEAIEAFDTPDGTNFDVSGLEDVESVTTTRDGGTNLYTLGDGQTFSVVNTTIDNTGSALELNYEAAATAANVTLDGVTNGGGTAELEVDGAGLETLNLSATGDDSAIGDLDTGNAGTLSTVNIDGDAALSIDDDALDNAITTVDGSASEGDLTFSVGTGDMTVTTGSGDDSVTASSGDDTYTLGAGDDRVAFGGNLDGNDEADGGEGEDTIASSAAFTAAGVAGVANFEVAEFTDNQDQDLSILEDAGLTTFLHSDGTADTIAVTNNKDAFQHIVSSDQTNFAPVVATDDLSNTLNVELVNADIADDIGDDTNASGYEVVNLTSSAAADGSLGGDANTVDADGGDNGLDLSTGATVNIDGDAALTIGGSADSVIVDASDFGATLDVTTSSNADEITDGSGDDVIRGSDGVDTITLSGGGEDRVVYSGASQSNTANTDVINDFDAAGDDGIYFDASTNAPSLLGSAVNNTTDLDIIVGSDAGSATTQTISNATALTIGNAVALEGLFGSFASTTAFKEALTNIGSGLSSTSTYAAFAVNTAGTKLFVAEASASAAADAGIAATGDVSIVMEIGVENVEASDLFIF